MASIGRGSPRTYMVNGFMTTVHEYEYEYEYDICVSDDIRYISGVMSGIISCVVLSGVNSGIS